MAHAGKVLGKTALLFAVACAILGACLKVAELNQATTGINKAKGAQKAKQAQAAAAKDVAETAKAKAAEEANAVAEAEASMKAVPDGVSLEDVCSNGGLEEDDVQAYVRLMYGKELEAVEWADQRLEWRPNAPPELQRAVQELTIKHYAIEAVKEHKLQHANWNQIEQNLNIHIWLEKGKDLKQMDQMTRNEVRLHSFKDLVKNKGLRDADWGKIEQDFEKYVKDKYGTELHRDAGTYAELQYMPTTGGYHNPYTVRQEAFKKVTAPLRGGA